LLAQERLGTPDLAAFLRQQSRRRAIGLWKALVRLDPAPKHES
jgi:hypothetical protein